MNSYQLCTEIVTNEHQSIPKAGMMLSDYLFCSIKQHTVTFEKLQEVNMWYFWLIIA